MIVAFDPRGLERCIHCGLCLEACPTYRITRLETESPRGRLHLMSAIADGRVDLRRSDAAIVHLDRCLACRACEAVCPSGVPYGHLIEEARAAVAWSRGMSPAARPLLWIVSRPAFLRVVAALFSLYERTGLRRIARRFLPARLRRFDDLAPPLARPQYQPVAVDSPRSSVALLLGCVMRVSYGDVHTATARVLARLGVAVVESPGQTCCGALHAHAGETREAVRLAKRNIAAFERSAAEVVLVNAAGCGAHLKSYVHLLDDDPAWRERAVAFAARVRDVSEHLAGISGDASLGELAMRVTYQDPCHLAHAQGIRAEPRALLRRVEGLDLVEMTDADVCCGSAGYYNLAQPEYADRLLEAKTDAILATNPDAVVTANPGCMLQIAAGLRARGRGDIPVLHVVEVLDRARRGA
ncbi:MAG TPA: heterodisulfide reductase-related iron-sulfur binding cluster [Candidatus Limnocylindria bacterium]|nr:heterodisulfide reductase-related iron-sulfur binding cluster [Candidatus Limnocylindria bacterium]